MPKKHKIRWRDSDVEQLAKKVKNYNAKLAYILKKNPEAAEWLPEKVTMKEIRKTIGTRRDYDRTIKRLESFTQRKAETPITNVLGEKRTIWEINWAKKDAQIANKRQIEKQKIESVKPIRSDGQSINVRSMVQNQKNKLYDADKFKTAEKGSFKDFAKYMRTLASDAREMQESVYHLEVLKKCIDGQYSAEHAKILKDMLDKIGAEKLLKLYYEGVYEFDPDFHYDLVSENEKFKDTVEMCKEVLENE